MRALLASLLLLLPLAAHAQATRMGDPNLEGALVVPTTPAPRAAPAPAPTPQRPAVFGGFKPLSIDAPKIGELFTVRNAALDQASARAFGTDRWAYAVYTPGGPQPAGSQALVVMLPQGANPAQAMESLDLRAAARTGGWRLIALPTPAVPPRPTSGTARDMANAQDARDGYATAMDRLLASVLGNEGTFQPPALVAMEGTGESLLALLCARTTRAPQPSHAVVMGGALDAQSAATCQPSRVPALLVARSTSDTALPYGGGEQPPGPTTGTGTQVLSAAVTRGLWAVLARCGTEPPTLTWLPSGRGRLALETHTTCRAGGPVSLLSALDGAQLPAEEELAQLVGSFVNGGR